MKTTLQNITEGFKICDSQKIELTNSITYYFLDYSDMNIPTAEGNIAGKISRYSGSHEMGVKWYTSKSKFKNAIKRHLKKQ